MDGVTWSLDIVRYEYKLTDKNTRKNINIVLKFGIKTTNLGKSLAPEKYERGFRVRSGKEGGTWAEHSSS